ncbi:MAG: DUF2938 domain-containing protein [Pseudorhodoplanes sp.]|nr:DUF2938 domain-containing protein [Pseudorhodoplanes sp.]
MEAIPAAGIPAEAVLIGPAILIGTGATAFLDLCAAIQHRLFGTVKPNYALVGRWLAHLPRGRFFHDAIAHSAPTRGERAIGWVAHYAIGIGFAAILLAIWGSEWTRNPALLPALIVGIGSVAAPFLLMQPGMGLGIAANHTANPNAARLRSLATHTIFGIGLYAAGSAARLIDL